MLTIMSFGERLKELREAAGLSQDKLARAADLSTSTVAKMEQRAIDPSWSTVQALARALGVSVQAFEDDAGRAATPAPSPKVKRKRS
ncbi:MAG TPA: helix-turn-helix transcriptional regulator [Gemmataceae bacterium]|jgi:transcriptional regulator with XRE-family HTH domain